MHVLLPTGFCDKSFQRGQTWLECLHSWEHRRAGFLTRVNNAPPLPRFTRCLSNSSGRILIWYDQWSLDCHICLPSLASALNSNPSLEVRFFDSQVFFNLFHEALGRPTPRVLFLIRGSRDALAWGPRPPVLDALVSEDTVRDSELLDQKFLGFDQQLLADSLDESLSSLVANWAIPAL